MSRVLILTPYFSPVIGGVESNAGRLAAYLAGADVSVQVLTKRLGRDLPDADSRDGVPIRRIGPCGERSSAGKWLLAPFVFGWLVRHARDYDVVCVVDYRAVGLSALAARMVTGRPVVFQAQTTGVLSGENVAPALTRIGVSPAGALGRAVVRPLRVLYGGADAYACISHVIEREVLGCGVPPARVHFLPNAIDMTRFRPADRAERDAARRALNLAPDAVVCLFVGRLSLEKGVVELVDAWRRIQPVDAMLVVAGPDMTGHPWDAGARARADVERHGLGDRVRFVGAFTDIVPLLRASDVAVQPSHFEALGLSAIECLASGLPVVASAVGGLLDFVVDGENGRLVPPRDPLALASALRPLLVDAAERARLAARARASVANDYDERVVFDRMRQLFDGLAEGE